MADLMNLNPTAASARPRCAYPECGGGCAECQPSPQPAPSRFELAQRMGDEAAKAMLLDPCKLTPALDTAVAAYLSAIKRKP